jgi:mono/diheme cytochrome c family protein
MMNKLSPTTFATPYLLWLVIAMITAFSGVAAHAQAVPAQTRGELLYTTHCITCHTSEMHWRNNRKAQDWDSLKTQVRIWQGNTGLQWSEPDIAEVAAYLNDTIYQYPQTANRVGMMSGALPKSSGAR